ncbi:MAG TPA: efflux RND transporter periplasmic adaptor subunit [Rhizomicrobium sp.]|jgi:membrane fusion protein (multidrug efflux system)
MSCFRRRSLVLSLFATLALAGCGRPNSGYHPGPPEVGVVTIQYQHAELTTELTGRTSPYKVSDVRPQVNGILKALLFTEGGYVKAGQPLYQIDPAPYQAAYDNATAALAAAKAKAVRYGALLKVNAVAPQDYDDAQAAYKQALANAESARINLGYTRITAPISGRIGRSAYTQGALVTADQTTALATIQTLDPIYVDMNQSSAELLRLESAAMNGDLSRGGPVAARVMLKLDDGTDYPLPGKLQFSEVTVDPNTGAVVLRAIFPNPKGLLLPGMFVRATVVEGVTDKAILAPQQGVTRDTKGDPAATVVDDKGIARLRNLTVGQTIGSSWLVTSGLKPGDRLIVQGLQRVQVDKPVHAVPASGVH